MDDFGIYMIKNLINNKVYIGKTEERFYDRMIHHRCLLRNGTHNNKHLQRSFNKYGEQNFKFEILHICNRNDNINELEKHYISLYDAYNNGYNQTLGGEGTLGHKLSEEAKKTIGEKNRINMIGKKFSKETKNKMSESHKGYIKTEEHRQNLSKSLTGKTISEETKNKCRVANQGSKQPTSKYTEELIYEVKLKLKNGYTAQQIEDEYNIPKSYAYQLKYNNRWKHVVV
ncbi:MAG: GIY-YIG nuclease family protein [Clostridium sp.]|uniref:GIY-YIG nuclease family protein n=1 Tax=Clostridium sp. TaxID=1506 RepID=UPI0025C43842|nr:GIY-YIG nuclease family protein [Clostridium sp.]MCE5220099.1 GIY-YIG nuclease family protein [Clostridium sp.]